MSSPPPLAIGSRIQLEEELGTVRFIGQVPPTKGEWLGIEWDNPARGKHSGDKDGVKYFECTIEKAGSFIRNGPKVQLGRSFIEAITKKYMPSLFNTDIRDDEYDKDKDTGMVLFGGDAKIEVEMVGFQKIERKQKHLDRLKEVGLRFEQISWIGLPGEISSKCPNIIDLDLSKNLLATWDIVAEITSQLPLLETLRLNYCRFKLLTNDTPLSPNLREAFLKVKSLSLIHSHISFTQVQMLEPCFPQLEALQLGYNDIRVLAGNGEVTGFAKLRWLNLEDNIIENWEEVERLSKLPELDTLYLWRNSIPSIAYKPGSFEKLGTLYISDNNIQGWDSVNQLNLFPRLKELRLKENPVVQGLSSDHINIQLVGRIKNLQVVNGITIPQKDRNDMERYYLILSIKDGTTQEQILAIHPRYKELCELHGRPEADTIRNKTVLKDRLISLTITKRTSLDSPPVKTISKKLLQTIEIRNLKNLLQKLLGVPSTQQRLYCIQKLTPDRSMAGVFSIPIETGTGTETEPETFILEMNDDLRELGFWDAQNGDEIAVVSDV